jgi:hypothetical protein
MVLVVALAAIAIVVLARYQQRKIGRGEKKRGKEKIKTKNNKSGAPCDQARGFPLVLFEHL